MYGVWYEGSFTGITLIPSKLASANAGNVINVTIMATKSSTYLREGERERDYICIFCAVYCHHSSSQGAT